jgi:hypothetical protein
MNQQSSGNPPHRSDSAIGQCPADILAKAIFEVVAIAFLQTQFVVMNKDDTIHRLSDYKLQNYSLLRVKTLRFHRATVLKSLVTRC